jgi:hypothetical protein
MPGRRWLTTTSRAVAGLALLAVISATAFISRPADVLAQSGPVSITTDKSQYQVGEAIRICYRVPGPGRVTITDTQGGTSKVILSGNDDGRGDCVVGRVEPPPGQECFRLDYAGSRGTATAQTCITIVGQPSNNPGAGNPGGGTTGGGASGSSPAGTASITTDKTTYQFDEPIRICYTVPGPGPITITDTQGGTSKVILSGNDDGRGDCLTGIVTPPAGQECFRLDYQGSRGSGTAQTCIEVRAPSGGAPSPSPSPGPGDGGGQAAGGAPPPSPGPSAGPAAQAGASPAPTAPAPTSGAPSPSAVAADFPPSSAAGTPAPGWPNPFKY